MSEGEGVQAALCKWVKRTFRESEETLCGRQNGWCGHRQRAIKSLSAELRELKRETRAQFEATQISIATMTKSITTIGSAVDNLHHRVSNHSAAFLLQLNEQATRTRLAQVALEISQHMATIKFGPPDLHEAAKAEYAILLKEQAALTKKLSEGGGQALALLGGTLASTLPPPQTPPGLSRSASTARSERSRTRPPSASGSGAKRHKSSGNTNDDSAMSVAPN
ncbi:hypothetical protein R3P38DRAFT_2771873 [Favolaschia claudopus]|uniref:Uncharacterized protein n=1 Tax=Favolaschia claudopus TaxID=2862362 RepID=A0AAW0C6N9_9AGAR